MYPVLKNKQFKLAGRVHAPKLSITKPDSDLIVFRMDSAKDMAFWMELTLTKEYLRELLDSEETEWGEQAVLVPTRKRIAPLSPELLRQQSGEKVKFESDDEVEISTSVNECMK